MSEWFLDNERESELFRPIEHAFHGLALEFGPTIAGERGEFFQEGLFFDGDLSQVAHFAVDDLFRADPRECLSALREIGEDLGQELGDVPHLMRCAEAQDQILMAGPFPFDGIPLDEFIEFAGAGKEIDSGHMHALPELRFEIHERLAVPAAQVQDLALLLAREHFLDELGEGFCFS